MMVLFHYRAKLDPSLLNHIIENGEEFERVMKSSVEAFGGNLIKCAVSASSGDPIGFLEFPNEKSGSAWQIFYKSQEGVLNAKLELVFGSAELCDLKDILNTCATAANKHR